MKALKNKKILFIIVCVVLVAAVALTVGIKGHEKKVDNQISEYNRTLVYSDIGKGEKCFKLYVVDGDKNTSYYNVYTDCETVGEALEEINFISGDQSEYGLYVKTVNGITVDYENDKKYWEFQIDGEMASVGVDMAYIDERAEYSFVVSK